MATTNISIAVDELIKKQAEEVLSKSGIDIATAVNLYLKQTVDEAIASGILKPPPPPTPVAPPKVDKGNELAALFSDYVIEKPKAAPKPDVVGTPAAAEEEKEPTEEDILNYLYPKEYQCPVCDKTFMDFIVKKSKVRSLTVESDFRTIYKDIDPYHYDITQCSHCGYAALASYFDKITERQQKMIKENISPGYKPHEFPMPLSIPHVMERYKQALMCADAIGAKASQKAFVCLRLAWVLRGTGSNKELEQRFLRQAFEGLKDAFGQERFPLGGMDELTAKYIIADIAFRLREMGEALRWVGDVVVSRSAQGAIKERASVLKDLIRDVQAGKPHPYA